MYQRIDKEVEALQKELVAAITKLVAIESIQQAAQKGAPYGRTVRLALDEALAIASSLGFKTVDVHHHIGYAANRKGREYIGIFGHVDVVAANGSWQSDPFTVVQRNGRLYGRGVLDNKGPILSCLFALKAIQNAHVSLNRPVRIIFGCNEESGMQDIPVYLKYQPAPIYGFTPDCKFPAVYSERGSITFQIHGQAGYLMDFLNQYVLGSNDIAKRMGISYTDEIFGRVEIRGPKLQMKNRRPYFQASLIYPYGCDVSILEKKIVSLLNAHLSYERVRHVTPLYHDPQEPMLDVLQKAYAQVTGDHLSVATTSGGTYAKVVPHIVPFGPSFPGQKGISHLPNEWLDLKDLETMTKIYAHAIIGLDRLHDQEYH